MKTNIRTPQVAETTHEGARAKRISETDQLKRSVMSCFLWEDNFYEGGIAIAERIQNLTQVLITQHKMLDAAEIALTARHKMNLRHVPLLILSVLAENAKNFPVGDYIFKTISRADELTELISIYWKLYGRKGLPKQMKLGIGKAFGKFNEYQFAKYNRPGNVRLIDAMRLTHPKPADDARNELYKKIKTDSLATPDTWEVELSAADGKSKTEKWTRLLSEGKLGGMALIRNLRNFVDNSVDEALVRKALEEMSVEKILPYRFIAAAIAAPRFEKQLESAFFKCLEGMKNFVLDGQTFVLVDVSGSMNDQLGGKSKMRRCYAASALAMILEKVCKDVNLALFANELHEIPRRSGFALRDKICQSVDGGTYLGAAVFQAQNKGLLKTTDRLIIITDEQSADNPALGHFENVYVLNVGCNKNGIGYGRNITHIDGFSSAVIEFIIENERDSWGAPLLVEEVNEEDD